VETNQNLRILAEAEGYHYQPHPTPVAALLKPTTTDRILDSSHVQNFGERLLVDAVDRRVPARITSQPVVNSEREYRGTRIGVELFSEDIRQDCSRIYRRLVKQTHDEYKIPHAVALLVGSVPGLLVEQKSEQSQRLEAALDPLRHVGDYTITLGRAVLRYGYDLPTNL